MFEVSAELLSGVGVALIPVLLFIWWEFRGRRMRDRRPVAQLLYNEVQGNYQGLQTRLNDALAVSRKPQDIVNMDPLEFKETAFIGVRDRIDALPSPLATQVLDLYSSLQRLRDLQLTLGRLPKPAFVDRTHPLGLGTDRRYERDSVELFRSARTTLELSRRVVVHLYHAAGIEADLRQALRDPRPRSRWDGPVDRRVNRVILVRMPLWLYPIVQRWRDHRTTRLPVDRKAA